MTNMRSAFRTTQTRYICWNLVSTPMPKSDGNPTLNTVLGSNSVLGRKNRRNMRKLVARNPPTSDQMMPRRILSTGSTGFSLSTVLVLAPAEEPTAGLADLADLSVVALLGGVTALGFSSVPG